MFKIKPSHYGRVFYFSLMNINNFLRIFLIINILSIALFPYFGVIDPIASQWLILNLLNIIGLSFIFYGVIFDRFQPKFFLFKTKTFLYYGLYILLALTSITYSMNAYEAIVEFSRYFNTFTSFILLYLLLDWEKDKKFVLIWISFITFLELFFVLKPFIEDSLINGFDFRRSQRYNGLAANINITAFSLLLKLPFLIYSSTIFNSSKIKIANDILIIGIILSLIILKSRASFISFILIIVTLTIYYFLNRKNKVFLKFSIKLILVFFLLLSTEVYLNSSSNSIDRIGSITDSSLEDESINQRLNYYKSALVQFKEKPFGEGLGNWKIKSIKLNKDIIDDYIVPYHMHNDFLQNLAELGLIGFILYGLIFLSLILRLLKSIFLNQKNSLLDHFLLLGLIVYLIDASLNFPMARPMIQVYMILFFALILRDIKSNYSESKLANKILISFLALGAFLTLYVNYQSYITYKKQIPLMADFNFGKYTINIKEYENIDFKLPSLSVTTIPLNAMIARYYEKENQNDKAINLLHRTKSLNPYLGWNDAILAASYFNQRKFDSAIFYSEKAYRKIPNNNLHIRLMLAAAKEDKNEKLLDSVFLNSNNRIKNDPEIWHRYLNLKSEFNRVGDSVISELARKSVEKFPNNLKLLQLYKNIKIGQERVFLGINESKKAKENYLEEKYDLAEQQYLKAYEYDPLEYSYIESLVGLNVFLERYEKALEYYSIFKENHKTLDGKIEFLSGIAYQKTNQKNKACVNFSISLRKGYKAAREKLKNCNQ